MTRFVKVTSDCQIKKAAQLARTIWFEHYPSIIGIAQVQYMVEKFQCTEAIASQIEEGFQYFLIEFEKESVGYLAIKKEDDMLFLSKIYILANHRGKGLGKAAFNFIENNAKIEDCHSIHMTVNILNKNSIRTYEKLGYKNVGSVIKDIGEGFVMDDYKMVKNLD